MPPLSIAGRLDRRGGEDRIGAGRGGSAMRFMILVTGDNDYEAGRRPPPELAASVGALGEKMVKAGAMLEAGGLLPSSHGARLRASDGQVHVTDGPFAEAKEVIGGYAILRTRSKQEAIEYARLLLQAHMDVLGPSYQGQIEVRQISDGPRQ
jgi:hypothetical protein